MLRKKRSASSSAKRGSAGSRAKAKTAPSVNKMIELASRAGVDLVRFLICDTSSAVRGKCSNIVSAAERFGTGIGLVKGTMAMNMLDQLQLESGFGATGEVRMVPDPS